MRSEYMSDGTTPASSKWEELPGNRVKFLFSFGGKILPRPSNGQLHYVGGETRLVTVDRCITFKDFIRKLEDVFDTASVIIKYQLPTLDLDDLISVTCDEDFQMMMEEYDRYSIHKENCNRGRVRAFLFPQKQPPPSAEKQVSPKQKYIDAVNGVTPILAKQKLPSSTSSAVPDYFSDPEYSGATEIDCQSPVAPWTEVPPLTTSHSPRYEPNMRKVPSEGTLFRAPSKMEIELQRINNSPKPIQPYRSNIVPVLIYNIAPTSMAYLQLYNCHGLPATIYRECGSTPEGSVQLGTHAVARFKTVKCASNRRGSPLKHMTNHMKANRP